MASHGSGDVKNAAAVPSTAQQMMDVEREINRLIDRKRQTDLHIINLEARIYAIETEYLRDAGHLGSIFSAAGMEGYISGAGADSTSRRSRRNAGATSSAEDKEGRIFSNTSTSLSRVCLFFFASLI